MQVPSGFRVSGVSCGIKRDPPMEDLALVVADAPVVAAGVFTQNVVRAASVDYDAALTPADNMRVVVTNSGNANACTGQRGVDDTRQMAALAAATCGADPDQALVMSTGIIGEFLPMDKVAAGISAAAGQLATDEAALVAAARGIMTTDTIHKLSEDRIAGSQGDIQIVGMAKGSGMIGPNMATMLAIVLTDAALTPSAAQQVLRQVVDSTFNCVSVDGHTSTNDTVLLLASGAAEKSPASGELLDRFRAGCLRVCTDLARQVAADGEGATHLITVRVSGCATRDDAHRIAAAVANSPLVKTAVAGADPNWGRVVSAAGYAGVAFDPSRFDLYMNDVLIYKRGAPVAIDAASLSADLAARHETVIDLRMNEGQAAIEFWTSDLTAEYVRINADYHT